MAEELDKGTILDEIIEVASQRPTAIAIEQWSGQTESATTYEDLMDEAVSLARRVARRGERCIGLESRRSKSFVVGILGIMLARKAFVPIDPKWPRARIENLRSMLDIRLVLDEWTIAGAAASTSTQIRNEPRASEGDTAYFICSSGSTGKPKCIEVAHGGIPNLARSQRACFRSAPESRFLWLLSPMFDGSLSDIFVALSSGATLVIDESFNDNVAFGRTWESAANRKVSHIDIPPVLLRSVLDPAKMPECIETLIVGGESLTREVVAQYAPRCRLVNVYGPTEATICTSAKVYDRSTANPAEITIGRPFPGIRYKLRDETACLSELMISGKQLAKGYVGCDAIKLNAAKFVHDASGARWFMTGDLASRTGDGEWMILGRTDRQLKINGKLVAPEEIEAVAARHGITAAVVLHDGKLKCLAENSGVRKCSSAQLLEIFRKELPEWMVPISAEFVTSLPRLSTGKISYGEVMKMLERSFAPSSTHAQPFPSSPDEIMETVREMMAGVLKLPFMPDADASFKKDLGADSIQHIMLSIRLKGRWNVQLGASDFDGNDTPRKIAGLVRNRVQGKERKPATSLEIEAKKAEQGIHPCRKTDFPKSRVLLTGVTGFLGSHVLKELLNIEGLQISCIVKGKDHRQVMTRIGDALERVGITGDARENAELRLTCHNADLAEGNFGLEDSAYGQLCEQTGMVFHCAGEVNDWKAATELAEANVEATKNIVKFCVEDGNAKLAFASTLSVFASRADLPWGFICKEEPLSSDGVVVGGYAQSKWIAEKIVTDLVPAGKLKVLRYGLLTEPTGKPMRFKKSTLNMFLRGAKKLGILPEVSQDLKVDLTPVDIAAKATLDSLVIGRCKQCVIHVHAGMQVRYRDILDLLSSSGCVKKVSWRIWKELTAPQMVHGDVDEDVVACVEALARVDGSKFGPFDLFQSTGIDFERNGMLMNYSPKEYEREHLAHARYLKQLMRVVCGEKDW